MVASTVTAQKQVIEIDRQFPSSQVNSLSQLAQGPYPSGETLAEAAPNTLEKRDCTSGCCEPGYTKPCGNYCCSSFSCSKYGSGCGCDLGQIECSDGGCCPLLSTCTAGNKCLTHTTGGFGSPGLSASGALSVVLAMGAVFANV
ncbi:hypothetical protein BGZ54_005920 [Gamsiella multidivaricata]|nr:hypothetical protein BGZ54_005920 [Gamsiella multidivaricata]